MYQTSQITLNSLQKEDRRIRGQLYSAPTKERQFRDIKRQQDIKESLYLFLLQQREETAIRLGMYSPKAKVVETAHSSYIPVAPNKTLIFIASMLFGIAIPVGYIYTRELFNTTVQSKDDLLKILSAPYIGEIPKYGTPKEKKLVSEVDYSPKAEAFRMLRTNIDFLLRGFSNNCKTIFVTSTIAQEGKSHTSVNLATTISHSGKKVLLIETDIRVPSSGKYLNVKNKNKGLTDYIVDESLRFKDVVYSVEGKTGFDIIPSGTVPPNPAELLMSARIPMLLSNVKKHYDYVIVDTAAVGLVTDTLLFAEYADIFIYVVSANNIDKRQLHVAQTMYNEKRLPNMHLLLNGTKKIAGYGYGYGYGKDPESITKKWYDRIPFIKVKA
ncbi:MAG: polysaccharide biosynthesis tyrosine autokinase, partial [Winogradskyella sp.]|nr:polysaccharide biosynthesis tyrosine autokinase [Winogradskyella sp.]